MLLNSALTFLALFICHTLASLTPDTPPARNDIAGTSSPLLVRDIANSSLPSLLGIGNSSATALLKVDPPRGYSFVYDTDGKILPQIPAWINILHAINVEGVEDYHGTITASRTYTGWPEVYVSLSMRPNYSISREALILALGGMLQWLNADSSKYVERSFELKAEIWRDDDKVAKLSVKRSQDTPSSSSSPSIDNFTSTLEDSLLSSNDSGVVIQQNVQLNDTTKIFAGDQNDHDGSLTARGDTALSLPVPSVRVIFLRGGTQMSIRGVFLAFLAMSLDAAKHSADTPVREESQYKLPNFNAQILLESFQSSTPATSPKAFVNRQLLVSGYKALLRVLEDIRWKETRLEYERVQKFLVQIELREGPRLGEMTVQSGASEAGGSEE